MTKVEPIKLLVVSGSLGVGGAEMQAARMLPRMDRDLFAVEVAYYNDQPGPPREELLAQGIPVTFLGNPRGRRIAFLRDTVRYMQRGRFDIVHAWLASANHYGRLPAMLAGVPVTIGGLLGQKGLQGIWPIVYSLMNPFCDAWIVNSSSLRDYARQRMALLNFSPVFVVPNGIDLELDRTVIEQQKEFYASLKRDRPVVGLVARLHPVKNHGLLLAVAKRLQESAVAADYWLIGGGTDQELLAKEIQRLDLGNCVRLLGQRDDVAAAYEMMDVAVLTSESEGCPNVLLEAMRAGLPIVSTRCTSLDDVVEEGINGYTVEVDAVEDFADCVARLLGNAERRRSFGAASRRMVEKNFSMPVAVRRLEQAYLTILQSRRTRHAPVNDKLINLGIAGE